MITDGNDGMSGVADARRMGLSFVCWLSGGTVVGLLVLSFVPLFLSFGDARPLLLSPCNTCPVDTLSLHIRHTRPWPSHT